MTGRSAFEGFWECFPMGFQTHRIEDFRACTIECKSPEVIMMERLFSALQAIFGEIAIFQACLELVV